MGKGAAYPLDPQRISLTLNESLLYLLGPILFIIISFIIVYHFCFKPQVLAALQSAPLSSSPMLPVTHDPQAAASCIQSLSVVVFDEELKTRDPQCSVCLGEFEREEELQQVPYCKHIFHAQCIHQWLQSNSTCPLCRSPLLNQDANQDVVSQNNTTDTRC